MMERAMKRDRDMLPAGTGFRCPGCGKHISAEDGNGHCYWILSPTHVKVICPDSVNNKKNEVR